MATLHTHTCAAAAAAAALGGRAPNCSTSQPQSANIDPMHSAVQVHTTHGSTPSTSPASAPAPAWTIEAVTRRTLAEASCFVNASRRELFPSLGHDAFLDDARVLDESCVLIARSGSNGRGEIVAAIAYTPFDHRFPHLPSPLGSCSTTTATTPTTTPPSTANSSSSSLHTSLFSEQRQGPCQKTVEVIRLFVLPQYRRHGLAAALFRSLRAHAMASGAQCMYLHTHPFLPGAIRFWEKQGFSLISVDDQDDVWRTHHMRMMLSDTSSPST